MRKGTKTTTSYKLFLCLLINPIGGCEVENFNENQKNKKIFITLSDDDSRAAISDNK
jgi:hypothetical protein